jgi:glycosyltransferase involved in cell wall biosynthesis
MHLQSKVVSSSRSERHALRETIEPESWEPAADRDLTSRSFGGERRLRILLIVESSAGGTGRHVLDLAEGFIARGHRVVLVHSTIRIDRLFRRRLESIHGLDCVALPMRMAPHPADFKAVRVIRKLHAEFGPFDIIHGHSSKGGALARLAALGTPARAFYTLHGLNSMDPGMSWLKSRSYLAIEKLLAMRTQGIIAVSPEEARAAALVGLASEKIRTIPNGLDELTLSSRQAARRRMGVGDRETVIGFVGRLVEQKAPEILLEAFAIAATFVSSARLAVVGGGPLSSALVALSQRLGIEDKIVWLGERDAREVLSGFDIFALSSRKEGMPYVILEAMSAGLPLVATSSSGVELLIDPAANGIVVPPDNAAAFGEALVRLLKDPGMIARFGAASRNMIGRFSVGKMVDSTLGFYFSSLRAPAHLSLDECEGAAAA